MVNPECAIKLHDSEIQAITQLGGRVVVAFSAAYIHKYESDCGTGWTQAARFTFEEATISGLHPEFPCVIWQGSFKVDGKPYEIIPIRLNLAGNLELEFAFDTNHRVIIQGKQATVQLSGEPRFVENLPWRTPDTA